MKPNGNAIRKGNMRTSRDDEKTDDSLNIKRNECNRSGPSPIAAKTFCLALTAVCTQHIYCTHIHTLENTQTSILHTAVLDTPALSA